MLRSRRLFSVLISVFLVSSCAVGGGGSKIEVQDPWARAVEGMADSDHAGMGMNGAAYMLLRNEGDALDSLLRAESSVAQAVELHLSEMKDGVMSMHPVAAIEIPAHGQVELKPGSYHVMLIGLQRDLIQGEKFELLLVFEKSGEISIDVEVRSP